MSDDPTKSKAVPDGEEPEVPRTLGDPLPDGEAPRPDFTWGYAADVRAAEAAAQRSVCQVSAEGSNDDLELALDLRVEVNLAQADGVTVTRVGSTDPGVRDLEAPYRIRKTRET